MPSGVLRPEKEFTVGQMLAALGGIAVAISIILDWVDFTSRGALHENNATLVSFEFLFDKGTESHNPSILIILIPAAALLLLAAMLPSFRVAGVVGGVGATLVPVLYCLQVQRGLDDELAGTRVGLFDFIGAGVYVALVGGVVGVIGSLLPRPEQA